MIYFVEFIIKQWLSIDIHNTVLYLIKMQNIEIVTKRFLQKFKK